MGRSGSPVGEGLEGVGGDDFQKEGASLCGIDSFCVAMGGSRCLQTTGR